MKCTSHFLKILLFGVSITTTGSAQAQDIEWEKSYGGKHADYLFDAIATADYGFILAGSSLSKKSGTKTQDGMGDLDYWIWKMDEKGDLDWQKSFGGSGSDLLQSIKNTKDGGFILAGTSDSEKGLDKKDSCKGKEDYWIIKLNAKGNEEWQRTIGGSGQELLQSIFPTSDGGYIVGGSSSSAKSDTLESDTKDPFGKASDSYGNLDYWIVKLDSKGKIEWQQTFGGRHADHLRSILQTKDGGYLLGGSSNSPESGNKSEKCQGGSDYWVIKLDKSGEIEWQKVYGGDKDDQLYSSIQLAEGNYLLGGNSNSGASGSKSAGNQNGTDFWILKIDGNGEVIWQQTYNTEKTDLLTSVVENDDRTLLLGGYAQGESIVGKKKDKEGINDYIAIKIDENGEELWKEIVGSSGRDILRKAIEVRGGGYLLAGTSQGVASRDKNNSIGRSDFWVVKLKDKKKKKEKKSPIEAFPNPTQQFTNIIVGYEFEKGTATVYDLGGRQLQHFDINSSTVPIDLGASPEGIYIVEIRTNVQNDAVKVVKSVKKN